MVESVFFELEEDLIGSRKPSRVLPLAYFGLPPRDKREIGSNTTRRRG